jgi:hypothetical protein
MNLASLRQRLARIGATVAPPRPHPGLVVVFRSCDADGKLIPLPNVLHREPERRDPARGLDVLFLDETGIEFKARCAQ